MTTIRFWCCVPGCASKFKSNCENNVPFYRFPDPDRVKVVHLQNLTRIRSAKWLKVIPNLRTASKRICSKHFVTGSPAALTDVRNVDWIPSLNLQPTDKSNQDKIENFVSSVFPVDQRIPLRENLACAADVGKTAKLNRLCRGGLSNGQIVTPDKPTSTKIPVCDETVTRNPVRSMVLTSNITLPQTKYLNSSAGPSEIYALKFKSQHVQATPKVRCHSTQTEVSENIDLLKTNVKQIEILKRSVSHQQQEIESLQKRMRRTKVDLETLEDRPEDCKFFTGLDDCRIVKMLFTLIRPHMMTPLNLTREQIFLMTLQKLRFNYFYKSLSIAYEVCPATVSKYFFSTIYTIYKVMNNVVYWPERSVLKKHTPQCFRDVFGDSVSIIIDCFEIRGEKPSNPIAAAQQWSEYKKSSTLKYLIGISSTGSVIFVSNGYGGRASDKTIATTSGFLDKVVEGDTILADRGFLIEQAVRAKHANLNMPAFRKNGNQLSAVDIENTRKIATVRIHVERVIGQLREKYQLLKNNVPMSLILRKHNGIMAMDMIVFVAAILVNLCRPIIN